MKASAPKINPEKTARKLQNFISDVCKKEKISDVLIAVSGGVDSATCATLAVSALGREHVYPVFLPYGSLNNQGTKDAWLVINSLHILKSHVCVVDIKPFVDSFANYDKKMDDERKGNVMARMRMMVLYDLSKKLNYLVVGTENRTEHLLGYYTRFGDEASDIEPLSKLYKTQVFQLAKYIGVPQKIIEKSPTAGLWEGQTDEGEFGFSYKIADELLYFHAEKGKSRKEIISMGYDKKLVDKLWWWLEKGEFKSRVPYLQG